jgi:hypothetical protein
MRYMTDVWAKIGGEAEALVGLAGGSNMWTRDSGREHRDDLAKILVNFLMQSQPDQVIVAPRVADAPVLDVFQLFGYPRSLYDTPEAKKTVSDFFFKWGQYSVEFDSEVFRDKIQRNTEEKHLLITRERYPTFPKTTKPYKAGFIYLGQINIGALVERWRIVFRDVPSGYRHFLWLIPMNMIISGFEREELIQMNEISDPLKRAQKALDLLREKRWGWTGGAP